MASQNLANFALDGGDPRQEKNPAQTALDQGPQLDVKNGQTFTIEAAQIHNDSSILFEEYLHYASITRAAEKHFEEGRVPEGKGGFSLGGVIKNRFSKGEKYQSEGTDGDVVLRKHDDFSTVSDEEWRTASRATRTASWGTVFFLITTDILGPGGAP
jgi:hypothetical protein